MSHINASLYMMSHIDVNRYMMSHIDASLYIMSHIDARFVEFCGLKTLYAVYHKEASKSQFRVLSKSYFNSLWQKQMRKGVTDPTTGVHYKTYIRTSKTRGFAKCDRCEFLKAKIMHAKTQTRRTMFAHRLDQHYNSVNADREELARVARYVIK